MSRTAPAARAVSPAALDLRPATPADIAVLERFIAAYTGDGTLLPRTRANLTAHLGEFVVLTDGASIVGCGALQIVDAHLAEIRSLAVRPESRGEGLGGRIVAALVERARERGIHRVFCLTRKVDFFAHHGFETVPKEFFPHKIWSDCRLCPRRLNCDEVAMQRFVHAVATRRAVPAPLTAVRATGGPA
jgi:amino-acid N-acetyltransferase